MINYLKRLVIKRWLNRMYLEGRHGSDEVKEMMRLLEVYGPKGCPTDEPK